LWNTQTSDVSSTRFSAASYGWVALYEIWDLTEDSRLQSSYHIPLDASEVVLQLQSFLKFKMSDDGQRTFRRRWELGFPTSISHDTNVFSILRTVYILDRAPARDLGQPRWKSFVIPIETSGNLCATETILGSGRQTPFRPSLAYEYSLQFNEGNRHVFYRDTMGMSLLPCGQRVSTAIAIFELDLVSRKPGAHLVGHTFIHENELFYTASSFHPRLPLVAVGIAMKSGASWIKIWAFDTSKFPALFHLECQITDPEKERLRPRFPKFAHIVVI
jgi:hypothetical protein